MAYVNEPGISGNSKNTTPADNRKLIYGVLIALLLGTWGYIIYDKSKAKEQYTQLQAQYTNVDSARQSVQNEYQSALSRMDSLTGSNTQLQGSLAQRKSDIDRLKSEIKGILREKNGNLSVARAKIGELNGKINDLVAEVDRLKGENETLTVSNKQLTTERDTLTVQKQQVQQVLASTETEKERLEDVGSTLHASNINIQAINVKSNGNEKATTTARRADKLRVTFDLDENRIAPTGTKELYVVITAPDGKPVSIPAYGSGLFQTREDGEKVFAVRENVPYEQGQRKEVQFEWKQDGKYTAGDYRIEIYHNGFKIGQGTKSLKKGGLFG